MDETHCCRLALVILFTIGLTAIIVGFWLGFDRTAVRQSSIILPIHSVNVSSDNLLGIFTCTHVDAELSSIKTDDLRFIFP